MRNNKNTLNKTGIAFLFNLIGVILCNAQQWGTPQDFGGVNPTTIQKLNAIHFPDNTTGYIVGNNGTILKTTDAGLTWSNQISGTTNNLKSVFFTGAYDGWACGSGGTILRTNNGGATWETLASGTTQTLNTIFFTGSIGFSAGTNGTILKSTNNGTSWAIAGNTATISTTNEYVALTHSLTTSDDRIWVIAKSGLSVFTSNNPYPLGNYWSAPSSLTNRTSASVCFYSGLTYIVSVGSASSGLIKRSNDFGTSWSNSIFTSTVGLPTQLNSIHFINQTDPNGWTVGAAGKIYNSTNGGATWSPQISNTTQNLNSVFCYSSTQAWAVGDNGIILLYSTLTPTGNKETEYEDFLSDAFPNPTKNEITILYFLPNGEKNGTITIYDINSKKLKEQNVDNSLNNVILNIEDFEAGVYFYNITTETGTSDFKKIIISK